MIRIGISVTSAYQAPDVRDGPRQMTARVAAAQKAGLDSLFVGDHHVTPAPYYQNTPIMGRLLAGWDARPAGALFLLPLWNPVLVAEQSATLACIAEGPFILQCGLGAGPGTFRAMGTDIRFRPSALEESLSILRALWAGETVSHDGRWQFEGAFISPLPPSPIDVWIGASARPAIERAARLGDAWLADPGLTLQAAAASIEWYRECLGKLDKNVNTIAIRRDIHVADSHKDASAVRKSVAGYRGFDPDALIIGEPERVAEDLRQFESLGYTDIIIRNLHPDGHQAVASTERLAEVKALLNQE